MKISVILGHPYEKSFNHAIAGTAVETLYASGHEVFSMTCTRKVLIRSFREKNWLLIVRKILLSGATALKLQRLTV
jgi:hypothetical protein